MKNRKLKNGLAIALILGLAVFVSMPAISMAKSDKKKDQAVQTLLEKSLESHHLLKNNQVQVSASDDTITLSGTVMTLADKANIEKYARKVGENYVIVDNLAMKPGSMTDQQLLDKVVEKIKRNVFYSIFDWVTVGVTEGVVTLQGWVYEPWHRSIFEHQVEKVAGVMKVNNEIQILPVNLFDDQIRRRAARIIYDNSDFEPYALVMNPPVHIIVDNGRVTLYGYVTSSFQKNTAENLIAVDTNALQVVNDLQIAP